MDAVEYLANRSTVGTLNLHRWFDGGAIGEMWGSLIGKLYFLCPYRRELCVMEFLHSGKARKLRGDSAHDFPSTGSSRAIQRNSVVCGDESAVCDVINSQRGSNALVDMEHRIVLCAIRVAFPYSAETDAFLKIYIIQSMTNTSKHSSTHQETPQPAHPGVTFRAILIGIVLIPPNTYFIMANHLRYWSTLPTTMSLIYNVVVTLVVVTCLNFLLKLLLPRFALRQGELLTIYVILSISSAIAGHDMMQTVVPVIPNGFWFATPENEWQQLFWRHLPNWMTLSELSVLQDFYDGDTTFYTQRYLSAWWEPILWWTIFLSVLIWVMICIDLLLRKQWIERERLSYPICPTADRDDLLRWQAL